MNRQQLSKNIYKLQNYIYIMEKQPQHKQKITTEFNQQSSHFHQNNKSQSNSDPSKEQQHAKISQLNDALMSMIIDTKQKQNQQANKTSQVHKQINNKVLQFKAQNNSNYEHNHGDNYVYGSFQQSQKQYSQEQLDYEAALKLQYAEEPWNQPSPQYNQQQFIPYQQWHQPYQQPWQHPHQQQYHQQQNGNNQQYYYRTSHSRNNNQGYVHPQHQYTNQMPHQDPRFIIGPPPLPPNHYGFYGHQYGHHPFMHPVHGRPFPPFQRGRGRGRGRGCGFGRNRGDFIGSMHRNNQQVDQNNELGIEKKSYMQERKERKRRHSRSYSRSSSQHHSSSSSSGSRSKHKCKHKRNHHNKHLFQNQQINKQASQNIQQYYKNQLQNFFNSRQIKQIQQTKIINRLFFGFPNGNAPIDLIQQCVKRVEIEGLSSHMTYVKIIKVILKMDFDMQLALSKLKQIQNKKIKKFQADLTFAQKYQGIEIPKLEVEDMIEVDLQNTIFLIDGNNILPTTKHFRKLFQSYLLSQKIEAQIRCQWFLSHVFQKGQAILFFDERFKTQDVLAAVQHLIPQNNQKQRFNTMEVVYGDTIKADQKIIEMCLQLQQNASTKNVILVSADRDLSIRCLTILDIKSTSGKFFFKFCKHTVFDKYRGNKQMKWIVKKIISPNFK